MEGLPVDLGNESCSDLQSNLVHLKRVQTSEEILLAST